MNYANQTSNQLGKAAPTGTKNLIHMGVVEFWSIWIFLKLNQIEMDNSEIDVTWTCEFKTNLAKSMQQKVRNECRSNHKGK